MVTLEQLEISLKDKANCKGSIMRSVLFSIIIVLLLTNAVSAQKAQSVFVEALGLGGLYSLNYDLRFSSLEKSNAGIRVGGEYFEDIFIIPVQANYLLGKNGKFLELGAGATLITGVVDFAYGSKGFEVVPTIWLGYRYQQIGKGFTWRIGIASLTTGIPLWGGVSVGKNF